MFHRILVGVDDSKAAREALARAIELVEAGRGRLGLLCSAPSPAPLTGAGPIVMPVSRDQIDEELVSWAEKTVDDAAQLVPEDIPITKLVTRGRPGAALLREARTGCWDLLVVGQAKRRHRLFGPVGERLNRRSDVPVLVVHEDRTESRPSRRGGLLRQPRRRGPAQPTIA